MNIDPREWDLQERALREDAAYREVARALRRSPGEPPAEFAASVAALAASAPAHASATAATATASESALDAWVLRVGAGVLGVAFVDAIPRYGDAWREGLGALAALLGGSTALNWLVAAGACVALSWACAQRGAWFGRSLR